MGSRRFRGASKKRPTYPVSLPQRAAEALSGRSDGDQRRDEAQLARLELLRDKLTPDVTEVWFDSHLGKVHGIFKGLKGLRLSVEEASTHVLYTCMPTEVTSPRISRW